MKNYEVTLIATVRKVVPVRANDGNEAMDIAAEEVTSGDIDLADWEVLDIDVTDAEEHYEED